MITFTEADIQRTRPTFQMLVETEILSKNKANGMLAVLFGHVKHPDEEKRPTLLTRKQVADYLQVSPIQVDRLAKQGKLRKLSLGENTTRYSEAEVIQFALGENHV